MPQSFLGLRTPPGGAFGLPLVFEKSLARLELDGIDAPLERFGGLRVLLEARTRIGLFAEQLEEHGARAKYGSQSTNVEDTRRSQNDK